MSYWVVGGVFKDTKFKDLIDGESLQKIGPFESYEDAKKEWNRVSWQNVDSCNIRYIILPHK
tara:strand:+ start:54 stop:239 length:186 start_codon:yes stop_codon:yes gene_type:complete